MISAPAGGPARVLVVDDDPAARLAARACLEQAGYLVTESGSGGSVMELFERIEPDLLLVDVARPGCDGFAVCRQVREHPEGWHVPILMVTGLDDLDSIDTGYQLGATDFLVRPCDALVLGQRVRYLLRSSRVMWELSRSRSSLDRAQYLSRIGSWEWDVVNDVMHWSRAVYQIFEIEPVGFDKSYQAFINSVHAMDRETVQQAFETALGNGKEISIDHSIVTSTGVTRFLHTDAKVIETRDGRPARLAGTVQDITERKLQETRIARLAYFDVLTGLPNRALFKENLAQALEGASRVGHRVAVMFLDMDRFKEINDTMGHDVGDRLLQAFAERLLRCVRKINRADTPLSRLGAECPVGRLGGDEFTVILDAICQVEEAARVAGRIMEVLSPPYDLQGHRITVTVSIGISLYPEDGLEMETLLKKADCAMYLAKKKGRHGYAFYSGANDDAVPPHDER